MQPKEAFTECEQQPLYSQLKITCLLYKIQIKKSLDN